jgi:hypothetical protein
VELHRKNSSWARKDLTKPSHLASTDYAITSRTELPSSTDSARTLAIAIQEPAKDIVQQLATTNNEVKAFRASLEGAQMEYIDSTRYAVFEAWLEQLKQERDLLKADDGAVDLLEEWIKMLDMFLS